jgi:hypothetical protein
VRLSIRTTSTAEVTRWLLIGYGSGEGVIVPSRGTLQRLVDEAAARGVNSVLLDGLAITGELSTLEQYRLGKTIADYCLSRSVTPKVAVIRKPPVDEFGAQVARNRGLTVEVFSEREAALSWLKAFDSAQSS